MTPEDGQSEVDRNVVSLMITITIKVANWSLNTSNCIPHLKNQTNHCQMRKDKSWWVKTTWHFVALEIPYRCLQNGGIVDERVCQVLLLSSGSELWNNIPWFSRNEHQWGKITVKISHIAKILNSWWWSKVNSPKHRVYNNQRFVQYLEKKSKCNQK